MRLRDSVESLRKSKTRSLGPSMHMFPRHRGSPAIEMSTMPIPNLSNALVTARKECHDATTALHEAALKAAGIPESDPLWEWVRKVW